VVARQTTREHVTRHCDCGVNRDMEPEPVLGRVHAIVAVANDEVRAAIRHVKNHEVDVTCGDVVPAPEVDPVRRLEVLRHVRVEVRTEGGTRWEAGVAVDPLCRAHTREALIIQERRVEGRNVGADVAVELAGIRGIDAIGEGFTVKKSIRIQPKRWDKLLRVRSRRIYEPGWVGGVENRELDSGRRSVRDNGQRRRRHLKRKAMLSRQEQRVDCRRESPAAK
jgi:hypothetical protein